MIFKTKLSFKLICITLFSFTLLLTGCKPEEKSESNSTSDSNMRNLQNFLNSNQPRIQEFVLEPDVSNEIIGKKGTRISIPENAFVNAAGNPILGGFSFQLQEIFSPADMMFSQKMTTSGGQILNSGGELYVNALQNGKRLELAPGKKLGVKVPTKLGDPAMELFVGIENEDGFDWAPNPATQVSTCNDSVGLTVLNYCFNLDSLFSWINCDYFNNDPRPLTEVEIVVPMGYTDLNTMVLIYIPSTNSMVRVSKYLNGSFYVDGGYKLPVGLPVIFIGIKDNGNSTNLSYSIQNATIVNNHIENLAFQTITAAQLLALMNNF